MSEAGHRTFGWHLAGSTRYKNSLTAGAKGSTLIAKFINAVVRPRVFPHNFGEAWLQHNIEEVGAFESFLPGLYATYANV